MLGHVLDVGSSLKGGGDLAGHRLDSLKERVDVMLGVDLVYLSAKQRITDAVLIAGDSDFLPAVEAAQDEGVLIHLFHGKTPHNELYLRCDERSSIDQQFIDAIRYH